MRGAFALDGTVDMGEVIDLLPADPMSDGQDLRIDVLLLLFSDAQNPDAAPGQDSGGWWADSTYGSILWTYRGQAVTAELLRKIEDAARTALTPLIEDGVCESVSCVAGRYTETGDTVSLDVTLTRGADSATLKFADLWAALEGVTNGA